MTLFERFCSSSLDTAGIGLDCAGAQAYLSTPLAAQILAVTGVDGVCFCTAFGCGETIFVVDPSAAPGQDIYPVAKNLPDFFGLVLACGGTAAICQAWQWSRSGFDALVQSQDLSRRQQSILRALRNTYTPPRIDDPYAYMQQLREQFDYTSLPLHPDYDAQRPVRPGAKLWPLGFEMPLDSWEDSRKSGKVHTVAQTRSESAGELFVPAIYRCPQGIVIDLCMPPRLVSQAASVGIRLLRGGKPLLLQHTSSVVWSSRSRNSAEALRAVRHYALDPQADWLIFRCAFAEKPAKNTTSRPLSLSFRIQPSPIPAAPLLHPEPGAIAAIQNPLTGDTHKIQVLAVTNQTRNSDSLSDASCHFVRLECRLSPDLSDSAFCLYDAAGTIPTPRGLMDGFAMLFRDAAKPAAALPPAPTDASTHAYCSICYDNPPSEIRWQPAFFPQPLPEETLQLTGG